MATAWNRRDFAGAAPLARTGGQGDAPPPNPLRVVYDPGTRDSGVVEVLGAGGDVVASRRFHDNAAQCPGFVAGTLVDTSDGPVAVERIRVGDAILTRDSGFQAVRWVVHKHLTASELRAAPDLQPIRLRPGSLGQGLPLTATEVSPRHRLLLCGARAELLFGNSEILTEARHLTCCTGVAQGWCQGVTYVGLMFDAPEILRGNGAWGESFQPEPASLATLTPEQSAALCAVFPDDIRAAWAGALRSPRPVIARHELALLLSA